MLAVSNFKPCIGNFSPVKNRVETGQLLLTQGEWYVARFGFAKMSNPINWDMNPFNDRSWVWLLHQFEFFRDLIAYDMNQGGREGRDLCVRIAFNWWAAYCDPANSPTFAWHDHGSAKRANNMLYLRDSLFRSGITLSDKTAKLFSKFFAAHAQFLSEEVNYSKGTNHGLDQALALLALANQNRSQPWSEKFSDLSLKRIRHEIQSGFASDGGHRENSINYQDFGIRQIRRALRELRSCKGVRGRELETLGMYLDKAVSTLVHMITPTGRYPMIGDTEDIDYPDILANLKDLPAYQNYLYAKSAGTSGVPPIKSDLILVESGWAILRSGWTSRADLHLITKCAFNSRYHRHDDDTSFVLHAFGEEWITDGGLFNYEEGNLMRQHVRSHYAHSLTAPNNGEATRDIKVCDGRNQIESSYSDSDVAWVQMVSFMFPGYISKRKIALARDGLVTTITDHLAPVRQVVDEGSCTTRFLIPDDKVVKIEGSGVRVSGKDRDMIIRSNQVPTSIGILRGQREPELRGWQSRKFNEVIPAQCIEMRYDGGTLDVTHELTFVPTDKP